MKTTDLIADILFNLVNGELLQLRKVKTRSTRAFATRTQQDAWSSYLQKTYLKMAYLIAKGGRAAVMLGGMRSWYFVALLADMIDSSWMMSWIMNRSRQR